MPDTINPVVDHLYNSGEYVVRPNVEIFFDHQIKDKNGHVQRDINKETLEKIAAVNNQKVAMGALSPVGPGHTYDDEYDAQGKLIRKFPEDQQPAPFGYYTRYRVALNPQTGKWALYADEHVKRYIKDPQTGRMVDGLEYTASFPRRSAEVYFGEHWIDYVAALRRAPKLDLPLNIYSKANPDHAFYVRTRNGEDAPVCRMAREKYRYSFDTGGEMDPNNPVNPPNAGTPPTPENEHTATPPVDNGQPREEELPPEHKEAAEKYAMHTFGMPAEHCKKLMGHLKQKYGMECGIAGEPNTQYGMGIPGGAATAPAPATPHTPKMEPTRMQHDQDNIEKARYAKAIADLEARVKASEDRAAAAAEAELHAHYERELMQLVYEGYEGVDAAKEMEFVTKRKYSRQQFDDHVGILRRLPKAPIHDLPPISVQRDFRIPSGSAPDNGQMSEAEFAKLSRYQRQHPELSFEQAKERYNKPNGVAK